MNDQNDNIFKCKIDKASIEAVFNLKTYQPDLTNLTTSLGSYKYQINLIVFEFDGLFKQARKLWRQLEDTILTNANISHTPAINLRKYITHLLHLCMCNLHDCSEDTKKSLIKNLQLLENSMCKLNSFDESILAKLSHTSMQDFKSFLYHYFHCYLDVKWHLIILNYFCGKPTNCIETSIKEIMLDLTAISKKSYLHVTEENVLEVKPFICPCVEEMWLKLQIFTKNTPCKIFWISFNDTVKNEDSLFILWLMYHIAILKNDKNEQIEENHSLIESTLKTLLISVTAPKLLCCLQIIKPLLNELWIETARFEPYQILWEYFFKNLNNISCNDNVSLTAIEIINNSKMDDQNVYRLFIEMLSKHLQHNPQQWLKLKGRIYSRLTTNKVNELNHRGFYNIAVLFINLVDLNFEEITTKLQHLCESLPENRQDTGLIWNIYIALVILYIKRNKPIQGIANPLLKRLEKAANERSKFHLIKHFINGLEYIIAFSKSFKLNQNCLISNWLNKYMMHCQHGDMCHLLNILICLLEKVQNVEGATEWNLTFKNYILRTLRQVHSTPNAPTQIGTLAAQISLLNQDIISDVLKDFSNENVSPKVTSAFICGILKDYPGSCILMNNDMNILVQAWVRCCMITIDNHEVLTTNILKLSVFKLPTTWFVEDPLCDFIEHLGNEINTPQLRELSENCFGSLDRWISPYITNPTNEAIVLRIYTCCAALMYHGASFLYHRTKSSCTLSRVITIILLPTEFLMGREPHPFVLSAIYRTLHLFIKGICKLNWKSDAFLERTLRDLIVRYIPYFSSSDSPLLKCLEDTTIAEVVLDKISVNYLTHPPKSTEENCNKALNVLYSFIESTTSIEVLKFVLQKVLVGVLEFAMFNSQRQNAIEIIKFLAASEFYISTRDIVRQSIVSITEKHVAFNTNNYFQFMYILIKLIPLDVQAVLPGIKQQVFNVEKRRGVGFDNVLRQSLSRVESELTSELKNERN